MLSEQVSWLKAVLALVAAWVAIALLLQPTTLNMMAIWDRSETYAHGFVILPIALWLVWRRRHYLATVPAAPDLRALGAIALLAAAWLVGRTGGVLVVEQYALVGCWIASVWLIMGWPMVRANAFPLGFLLLMVPNGEALIPYLINFTADFTVHAVRLVGIPVFREGPFFTLPTGQWNVVEGCSGLRYLIASFTLGVLYAYLTYRTLWKRLLFSAMALVVPVFANGMRATIIVLIAHYSDMRLALGVDHFIYGWVWFGIVMLAMFWVGLIGREDQEPEVITAPPAQPKPALYPVLALVAVLTVFTLYVGHLESRPIVQATLRLPAAAPGWLGAQAPFSDWVPHWEGADQTASAVYAKDGQPVLLYVAWYGKQRPGSQLISSINYMVHQKHPEWQNMGQSVVPVPFPGGKNDALVARLRATDGHIRILAWQWHRFGGHDGINPYLAKLDLTLRILTGRTDAGAAVIVATPYPAQDKPDHAAALLTSFLAAHKVALDRTLDQASPP
jgi:exosortase A